MPIFTDSSRLALYCPMQEIEGADLSCPWFQGRCSLGLDSGLGAGLYALFSNFLCRLYDFADGILGGGRTIGKSRLTHGQAWSWSPEV